MTAINQEMEASSIAPATTGQREFEFSQEYSKGELEETSSRELLDSYPE